MIIGVPKEIKNREHRVALKPVDAGELVSRGHQVRIETGAGCDSGFPDSAYAEAGATLVHEAEEAWAAELVVKVKEPLPQEYRYLRPGLCLFTFLHLAASPELARVLLQKKVRVIGYETVQTDDGRLPLLIPMSRIAGRLAVQMAARFLQRENGTGFTGKGILMGGIPGVPPALVLVIGGGHVGSSAAEVALGMGARVRVLDASVDCVSSLRERFAAAGEAFEARFFAPQLMFEALGECDVLIGAALIPGEHAPVLLTPSYLQRMAGGVFMDVAIDQGGISESSRPTTYAEPVYMEAGVMHCCLPNLPSAVPRSSTQALTAATFPYVRMLADQGVETAVRENRALARGVNTWDGNLTHAAVATAVGVKAWSDPFVASAQKK